MQGPMIEDESTLPTEDDITMAPPVGGPAPIDDAMTLRIVDAAYARSKDARAARRDKNQFNWDALHGRFDWLQRKLEGQSREVLASLSMALEDIADTLSRSLVGMNDWFSMELDAPEIEDMGLELQQFFGQDAFLSGETAANMLNAALERLHRPGNAIPTATSIRLLIYLACKYGLVESEFVVKASMVEHLRWTFRLQLDRDAAVAAAGQEGGATTEIHMLPGVPVARVPVPEPRLHLELVPYEDYYPDPSPHGLYEIHEVEIHRSDLAAHGFSEEQVRAVNAWVDGEIDAAKDARSADTNKTTSQKDPNRIRLREYWGNFIDPETGACLLRNGYAMTCGPVVLTPPGPNPWWHGRSPFVRCVLMPNVPSDPTHWAFFDWAVPLFGTECELTNLVIDGGFSSVHGAHEVDDWRYANPQELAKGVRPGLKLLTLEGKDAQPGIRRIDTGMLQSETLEVLGRITRMRQEATRTSDLSMGMLPDRAVKATEVLSVEQSSDALFREIAARIEDHLEPILELAWLTMWQGLDTLPRWISRCLTPEQREAFERLGAGGRFVALANGVRVKVAGLQQTQDRMRDLQKTQMLLTTLSGNPALLAYYQQENSVPKLLRIIQRALHIDPTETARDPNEATIDPAMLMGMAGAPNMAANPAVNPAGASATETLAPPNPMGERGGQVI